MIYKKISQKDFDEAEEAYDNCLKKRSSKTFEKSEKKTKEKATRAQYTGLIFAFIIIFYSFFLEDIPGLFFGLSFCIWMLHYFTGRLFGSKSKEASSVLRALSITLFFGSILLLIL